MSKITRRCGGAGHSSVHPLSAHSAQPFHVAVLGKHLGLEPAHGVGAGGRSVNVSPSNDDPHRRVLGQPFSVVGILVARQTTDTDCLSRPTNRCCTLRPPRLSCRHSIRRLRQIPVHRPTRGRPAAQRPEVMVAPRNSTRTRRSKTERGAGVGAFTHWVPPEWVRYQDLKLSNTTSLALIISITLCSSAISGSSVADYGQPSRVDMGNVGLIISGLARSISSGGRSSALLYEDVASSWRARSGS